MSISLRLLYEWFAGDKGHSLVTARRTMTSRHQMAGGNVPLPTDAHTSHDPGHPESVVFNLHIAGVSGSWILWPIKDWYADIKPPIMPASMPRYALQLISRQPGLWTWWTPVDICLSRQASYSTFVHTASWRLVIGLQLVIRCRRCFDTLSSALRHSKQLSEPSFVGRAIKSLFKYEWAILRIY